MFRRNWLLLFTIALIPFVCFGCGERASKFRLKFSPGDEYQYQLIQDSKTTTEFMGKKMEMPSTTEITLTQKVEKVDQGVIDLNITYDSFNMEMNMGGKQIPSDVGKSMVGKSIKMKMAENGEILEPQGIKSMVALQGLGSDVSSMFFSLYPKFPDRALKVGESWTQKQDIPQSQMGITVEANYTFTRKEEIKGYKCAVIDYTVSMNLKGGGETKLNIEGNGKGKGTAYFAYEKGLLVESEFEMDLTMEIEAPVPIGEGKIPTTTHQTIKLTLI